MDARKAALHVRRLFSAAECARVVADAEAHAARHGGWDTQRHLTYRSVDQAVHHVPPVRAWLDEQLQCAILPALEYLYGVPRESMWVHDAFVVRYRVGEQEGLAVHADQSAWSAVIALNGDGAGDGSGAFAGGGTWFEAANRTVGMEAGEVLFFHGKLRHEGVRVTRGTRYILALFFNQDTSLQHNSRPRGAYIAPPSGGDSARGSNFRLCERTRRAPTPPVPMPARPGDGGGRGRSTGSDSSSVGRKDIAVTLHTTATRAPAAWAPLTDMLARCRAALEEQRNDFWMIPSAK